MRLYCINEIAQPPEIIFPWIAEPQKAMKWQKNVKSEETVVSKPDLVGTIFRETVDEAGHELEMNGVITHYEPNKLIGFHLSSRIHEFDIHYCLEETGKSTRFSIVANVRWKFPMNIVSALTGKRMKRRLTEQLNSEVEELKRLL